MILIPVMYLRGGSVLKPAGSAASSPVKSDPMSLAHDWFKAGAELMHIVDLDTPAVGASPNSEVLRKLHSELKLPFEVEGNIRSIDTAEKYLNAGACRITLGTFAYQKPQFLAELCKKFPHKVAVHIDVRRGKVSIKGWSVATKKTALDYAEQFKAAGVDMIFYSDTEEEGMLKTADFIKIRDFLRAARVKLIHTTDVSSTSDLEQLMMLEAYGLIGTLVSKSLYEGKIDLENAITFVTEHSIGGLDEPTFTEDREIGKS